MSHPTPNSSSVKRSGSVWVRGPALPIQALLHDGGTSTSVGQYLHAPSSPQSPPRMLTQELLSIIRIVGLREFGSVHWYLTRNQFGCAFLLRACLRSLVDVGGFAPKKGRSSRDTLGRTYSVAETLLRPGSLRAVCVASRTLMLASRCTASRACIFNSG